MRETGGKKERKYWNDYLKDTRLQPNGEYYYLGAYYDLVGRKGNGAAKESGKDSEKEFEKEFKTDKGVSVKALILAALMMAISAMGGIMPATGAMDTFYVIIPYATTVILSGFSLYYTIKWVYYGGVHLKEHDYEKTIPKLKGSSKASFIAAIVAFLAEAVHLIIHGMGEYAAGAVVLMVCLAFAAILGVFLNRHVKAQEWVKING